MPQKITVLLLVILFGITGINAQTVSTLVDDSVRQFESIHWHPDGRIYSVDYYNGKLYQIETNGAVTTLVQGIPNIVGGGFDANDNFYFCTATSAGNIYRLNSDNSHTIVASGLNQPISVLPSASADTLFVTEYGGNSVAKVSLSSGTVTSWASGASQGMSGPDAIVYNHLNEIIVANFSNSKLFKITPSGVVTLFATLPSSGFMGYCAPVGSKLYVPSIGGKKIYAIDELGNTTVIAGSGMSGSNDGPAASASFTFPNGICSNPAGDTLLVTDDKKIRVITDFDQTNEIEEYTASVQFTLHPNAVENDLTVSILSSNAVPNNWSIYDSMGKLIISDSIQSAESDQEITLDVTDLANGNYVLTLKHGNAILGSRSFIKSD